MAVVLEKTNDLDVVLTDVAGIDVHRDQITITVLKGSRETNRPRKVSNRFSTITCYLKECGEWLQSLDVSQVLMESTGQYWRPVWQILERYGFEMILCNPRIIKNIPGKKTDQLDSEWLAKLARHGLVGASYIPNPEIQALRESTRAHKNLTDISTKLKNEIHNILQRSNIKMASVITDIYAGTGRRLLELLEDGEVIGIETVKACFPKYGRLKHTAEEILASLDGVLTKNDRQLLRIHMDMLACIEKELIVLDDQINEQLAKFDELISRLIEIPGVSHLIAHTIIAEVGSDVSPFVDAEHLASWAGVCPGNYESAGKKRGAKTGHGNKYLKSALVTAAIGAKGSKHSMLRLDYYRFQSRMGKQKAQMAVAHKILRIIYAMIKNGTSYQEETKSQRDESALAALASRD